MVKVGNVHVCGTCEHMVHVRKGDASDKPCGERHLAKICSTPVAVVTAAEKRDSVGLLFVKVPAASSTDGQSEHGELWVSDSGATHHMTDARRAVYDFRPISSRTAILSCRNSDVEGNGKLYVPFRQIPGEKVQLQPHDFAVVPKFDVNPFSLNADADHDHSPKQLILELSWVMYNCALR